MRKLFMFLLIATFLIGCEKGANENTKKGDISKPSFKETKVNIEDMYKKEIDKYYSTLKSVKTLSGKGITRKSVTWSTLNATDTPGFSIQVEDTIKSPEKDVSIVTHVSDLPFEYSEDYTTTSYKDKLYEFRNEGKVMLWKEKDLFYSIQTEAEVEKGFLLRLTDTLVKDVKLPSKVKEWISLDSIEVPLKVKGIKGSNPIIDLQINASDKIEGVNPSYLMASIMNSIPDSKETHQLLFKVKSEDNINLKKDIGKGKVMRGEHSEGKLWELRTKAKNGFYWTKEGYFYSLEDQNPDFELYSLEEFYDMANID